MTLFPLLTAFAGNAAPPLPDASSPPDASTEAPAPEPLEVTEAKAVLVRCAEPPGCLLDDARHAVYLLTRHAYEATGQPDARLAATALHLDPDGFSDLPDEVQARLGRTWTSSGRIRWATSRSTTAVLQAMFISSG